MWNAQSHEKVLSVSPCFLRICHPLCQMQGLHRELHKNTGLQLWGCLPDTDWERCSKMCNLKQIMKILHVSALPCNSYVLWHRGTDVSAVRQVLWLRLQSTGPDVPSCTKLLLQLLHRWSMQRSHIHWHWQALAGPSCLIGSDVVVHALTSPHTYALEALMLPLDWTEATDGTASRKIWVNGSCWNSAVLVFAWFTAAHF